MASSRFQSSDKAYSRRDLLRGLKKSEPDAIRPPWTREERIREFCTACNKCTQACPERIIIPDRNGFPKVIFDKGECTFCGECVSACEAPVFDRSLTPWDTFAHVSENCFSQRGIYCRSCGDMCQERAIRFQLKPGGVADVLINTENCNGCGACQSVCPANAIEIKIIQNRENTRNV